MKNVVLEIFSNPDFKGLAVFKQLSKIIQFFDKLRTLTKQTWSMLDKVKRASI